MRLNLRLIGNLPVMGYTQMSSKVGFWRRQLATAFEPACIVQLIQVELLRRRQSLAQNRGASLPNSQLLNSFVYILLKTAFQKNFQHLH